jgi:hypothetical protein
MLFKKGSIVQLTETINGIPKGSTVKITKVFKTPFELYEVQYKQDAPFVVVKCYVKK